MMRCYIDRCMAHSCTTKPCKENKNCYYKQLQRKEQECEELNEDIQGLKTNLLEKENCSARYYQIVTHREQNELYKKFDYQRTQKEKFKQALEKIEEYIKREHWTLMNYIREDILDIINEVKDD